VAGDFIISGFFSRSRRGISEPDCASLKFWTMENPFKPGDKVITKFMGAEVEVPVIQIYNNEVQIRTADNVLRWRTIRTVWFPRSEASAMPIQPLPSEVQPAPEPVPSPAEVLPVEPPVGEVAMVTTCGQEEAEELKRAKSKGKKRTKRKWF